MTAAADDPILARFTMDASSEEIYWTDRDGRFIYVNDAVCAALGYSREEMLGKGVWDIAPDSPMESWPAHRDALRDAGSLRFEAVQQRRDGRVRTVDLATTWISREGREFTCAFARDISLRKQVEDETREQERWLRESQQAGGIGSYRFDLPANSWKCTSVLDEIFGIGPEYPKTLENWIRLVAPDEREAMARYYASIAASGTPFDRQYKVVRICDGSERWVHGRGEFLRDDSGTVVVLTGTIMDITERKRAEEALRTKERILRALIDANPESLFLLRLDATVIEANRTFAERIGKPLEEILGRNLRDLQPKGVVESRKDWVTRMVADGKPARFEDHIDGRDRDNRFFPAFGPSGEIDMVAGLSIDVTERNRLQEQLIRNQKLESLGVLAGGIAHDFNNILTAILGNLSLSRRMLENGHPASERLVECERATIRASELTQQLLTFAKGGAPVKGTVEPGALIEEVMQFALRGSNVRGVVDLAPGLWCLDADEGQVGQLLNNLFINAKQAMPAGGTLTVRAANVEVPGKADGALPAGRYVSITVRDEGSGIPAEDIGRIFDPYFTTKPGGSGLGLASVHSIVHRHGGAVEVSSSPGAGAEFIVRLPAAAEPAPGDQPVAPPDALPGGNGRVLVMDDEEMLLRMAVMMLAEVGYEPDACKSGNEAVDRYRSAIEGGSPYAAVILDLTVPGGMGGKDAAARILELDPDAVLVVSSGYSNDPVLADPPAYGFKGAVAKPYALETLAAELARAIRR